MTGSVDLSRLYDLSGKVAIVTGSASGMGRETARYFAAAGAAVVIADRAAEAAEEVAAGLRATGAKSISYPLDVSDEAAVIGMMARTVEEFGGLDVLVNNAGFQDRAMLEDMSLEFWERTQAVNLRGPFLCVREAAKLMRKRGGGAIVNIASNSAVHPVMSGLAAYAASKAGMTALTRNAALELASAGIRVNTVLPGGVMTEGGRNSRGTVPEGRAIQPPPLGRIGQPEDIAALVLFLASPAAGYITGQNFVSDGGFLIG